MGKINFFKIPFRYLMETKIFVHCFGCYFIFFTFQDVSHLSKKAAQRSPTNRQPAAQGRSIL